jgi:hypothetical protein
MRSSLALVSVLPSVLGQAIPGTGENGEMGGIFGMGVPLAMPTGLSGLGSALAGLLGGGATASGGAPKSSGSAPPKSSGPSFDLGSLVPKGPEYPTGKTTLADFYNGGSGNYSAHFLTEASLPNHVIYAPKVPPPANVKMPVLIWGNGGCTSSGTPYATFLTEVASHGYLAIANGPPGGSMPGLDIPASAGGVLPGPNGEVVYDSVAAKGNGISKIKDMLDAIDWVVKGNAKKFGNIDIDTFITAGSSCGGLEAYSAAYKNPRVKLIGVYNSGILDPRKTPLLKDLTAAVAYFSGGPLDMGYVNVSFAEDTFHDLSFVLTRALQTERDFKDYPPNLPAFKGSLDSGHMGKGTQRRIHKKQKS